MNSKLATREETGLLKRNQRNIRNLFNMEINRCEDGISHFRLKYSEDYITTTITKVEYAHQILHNFSRCSQLVLRLGGSLEKLRNLEHTKWLGTNEDLSLNQELIFHEKQHLKLQHDSNDILEICNNLTAARVTRPHNPGAQIKLVLKDK